MIGGGESGRERLDCATKFVTVKRVTPKEDTMRSEWSWHKVLVALLVVVLGSVVLPSPAHAVTTFGGEATGVWVFVPATGLIIKVTTGQIPPSGGEVEASLLSGDIPSGTTGGAVALSTGTLHSVGVGLDDTDAIASQANVNLTVSGNGITSDFLTAWSNASCTPDPVVVGGVTLENLVINGQPIFVTGTPNQTVSLPNGTVVINEQTSSIVGSTGELSVTALHVTTHDTLTGQTLAEVKLAIGDAQIDCAPGSPPTGAATSGGGWITVSTGGKGTFGMIGGTQPAGGTVGHFVYINHDTGLAGQSTSGGTFNAGRTSFLSGSRTSGSGPVDFSVQVTDNGEPGSADTISITISGSALDNQGGTLMGGNIKVHRPHCP